MGATNAVTPAPADEFINSNRLGSRRLSIFEPIIECKSADQILTLLGPRNPFLLFVWIAMAWLWGVLALPIMGSAFLMDDFCDASSSSSSSVKNESRKCEPRPGTVTDEFNLDASSSLLSDLTTSAFVAGMAVGSIFTPIYADRHGRRRAVLFSLFLSGIVGCGSALSPNIFVFIGMRFLQGTSYSGIALINWVLAYECIPLRLRSHTALIFGLLWFVGYVLVAPIAYFTANWRQLIIALSAPSILFGILYIGTVPESFHFLVAKKNVPEVKRWLARANRCAKRVGTRTVSQPEMVNFLRHMEAHKHEEEEKDKAVSNAVKTKQGGTVRTGDGEKGVFSLFTRRFWSARSLYLYLFIFVYLWTCDTFIYYGLSLFSTQLAGNRYVNFTLVALVELPSYALTPVLIDKLGRRLFTALTHLLAALSFFAVLISDHPTFFLILWLIAKFAISCSFTGLFVYSSEIFPTVHRNLHMGICGTVSQGSSIFAPTVRIMARISPIAPMLFFGACSLVAGALTFVLPETKGKELPEKSIVA